MQQARVVCAILDNQFNYPPYWRFEIGPSVDNGQQAADNSLRVWRFLLKKLNFDSNFRKSCLKIWTKSVDCCLLTVDLKKR